MSPDVSPTKPPAPSEQDAFDPSPSATRPLKLLHVVTLITPDGAFGGPVRVATTQVKALRERGHEVTLIAGASGFDGRLPDSFDGVSVTLFPARRALPGTGFASTIAPEMLRWLRAHVAAFDLVHIHMARDLVTLPAARLALSRSVPYVLQTHGMLDPSTNILAKALDPLITVPVLRSARKLLSLTPEEDRGIEAVAGSGLPVERLLNGIGPSGYEPPAARASADATPLEVLFLARLHVRKRPVLFAEVASSIAAESDRVTFTLAGPDGGEASAVDELLADRAASGRVRRIGAVPPERVAERMASCDVYVLPSIDEPFPMSVLEAMSLGKPVIITDSCGLADLVARHDAGLVIGPSRAELDTAVRSLLSDDTLRARLGHNARRLAGTELSIEAVADRLEALYRSVS